MKKNVKEHAPINNARRLAMLDRLYKKAKELTKANKGNVYEIQDNGKVAHIKRISGRRPHKVSKKASK